MKVEAYYWNCSVSSVDLAFNRMLLRYLLFFLLNASPHHLNAFPVLSSYRLLVVHQEHTRSYKQGQMEVGGA